jgi:hypothetical protein
MANLDALIDTSRKSGWIVGTILDTTSITNQRTPESSGGIVQNRENDSDMSINALATYLGPTLVYLYKGAAIIPA